MAVIGAVAVVGASIIGGLMSRDSANESTAAATAAAKMQYMIADRIQKREEELRNLWRSEYKPLELNFLSEVSVLPKYQINYNTPARRAVVQVRRQFARGKRQALFGLNRFCVGAATGVIRDMAIAEAGAGVWAANTATNAEEEKKWMRDQARRDEIYRVVTLGHGQYTNSSGLAAAATIYGQISDGANRAAAGASQAVGYFAQKAISGVGDVFKAYQQTRPKTDTTPLYDSSGSQYARTDTGGAASSSSVDSLIDSAISAGSSGSSLTGGVNEPTP